MKINEAFKAGHLKLRLPEWARGEYLELQPLQGGCAPIGKLHSILGGPDIPADIRIAPQDVPLWQVPEDGWETEEG
jgi:hypothetical protein